MKTTQPTQIPLWPFTRAVDKFGYYVRDFPKDYTSYVADYGYYLGNYVDKIEEYEVRESMDYKMCKLLAYYKLIDTIMPSLLKPKRKPKVKNDRKKLLNKLQLGDNSNWGSW